jgi:hypothetical protein
MRAPGGDLLPVLLKKGSDAAPEEINDAVCRKRNATPSLTSASTATKARRSRLGAQWVAIHAEHCAARGSPARTSTRRSTSLRTPELMEDRVGFLDWMFRSRKTGRITLAQLPNWQFAVWLLASAVMWLGHPWGWVRAVLVVLASAALALWAGDEVLRGVNPFRRLLGFAVLSWLVFSLVRLG